ncbi:MAG: hypothetical protein NUV78_01940 [Candidatus Zambryskibacteria bacterium]|nr:hypothetical protein [Candidatus Zambryskibacteria bacterium]
MNSYWRQKATPWVSYAVLFGGLASALILFFLIRVENNIQSFELYDYDTIEETTFR